METPTYAAAVAAEVRASLGRAGSTQAQLALAAGMSKASLSRKLAGKQAFAADELLDMAPILNARASDWLAAAEARLEAAS